MMWNRNWKPQQQIQPKPVLPKEVRYENLDPSIQKVRKILVEVN